MSRSDFEIVLDNRRETIDAMRNAVNVALEAAGLQVEGYAKMNCPVDTGLLRNSITHALSGGQPEISSYHSNSTHANTDATRKAGTANKAVDPQRTGRYEGSMPVGEQAVYIGSNVEYAAYVELGTRLTKAQPFLKPAVVNHKDEIHDIFEHFLKRGS